MKRDEALLWLDDRVGRSVHVSVTLESGGGGSVLEGEGVLRHWSEVAGSDRALAVPRDDLAGWYAVGDVRFDLTDLPGAMIRFGVDEDEIIVRLSGTVDLVITEQEARRKERLSIGPSPIY